MTENFVVKIGDKVKVVFDGAVRELEIVDAPKTDPKAGKISWLSPIAQALLGKTCPQQLFIKTPTGKVIECQLIEPIF